MGKFGDTWRGVETITKSGETHQGVRVLPQGHHLAPYLGTYLVDQGVGVGNPR